MSEDRTGGLPGAAMRKDEAELRDLLVGAGRRPDVPAADLAELRETAHAEWARRYATAARRSRTPWWLGLAAAAAVVAALGLAWWARQPREAPGAPALAVVDRVIGSATWEGAGGRALPLHGEGTAAPLVAGTVVETGTDDTPPARLALRTPGGASLRLDAGSRLRLVSAGEVELLRGAVYVDSRVGAAGDAPPRLTVRTAHGLLEEVGTQFEVRLLLPDSGGEGVRLRVREGSVALTRGAQRLVSVAGEELLVAGGEVARRRLASDDPAWGWVLDAAPAFLAEDATVREVLDWVAREAGWRLELADDVAAIADVTIVHGSIAHLRPTEALRPVIDSAGLSHRVDGGRLIVTAPPVTR